MRCPRCNLPVADGAAICSNCDEILDSSFLEGDENPADGESTDVGPAPTAADPPRITSRTNRFRGGWNSGKPEPVPAEVPKGSYLSEYKAPPAVDPLDEARRSADDLASFFRSLSGADRWAAGGAAALLVSLALPWRWTRRDDEVIGLVAATPVALLAAAIAAVIYWRARKASVQLGRTLLYAQLAGTLLASGFTGWFIRANTDVRTVRAAGKLVSTALSQAEPGAWLGLLCCVVALVASGAAVNERR